LARSVLRYSYPTPPVTGLKPAPPLAAIRILRDQAGNRLCSHVCGSRFFLRLPEIFHRLPRKPGRRKCRKVRTKSSRLCKLLPRPKEHRLPEMEALRPHLSQILGLHQNPVPGEGRPPQETLVPPFPHRFPDFSETSVRLRCPHPRGGIRLGFAKNLRLQFHPVAHLF